MKYHILIFLLVFGLIACDVSSISVNKEMEQVDELSNIEYEPKGDLELGSLDSVQYMNTYFGFSLICPKHEWIILNDAQYEERLVRNKEFLNASDTTWEQTKGNILNLLTIEKRLSDTSTHTMQSISFIAEGLDKIPDVNDALEYLYYCKFYFDKNYSKNYPLYRTTEISTSNIGNREFLVQSITIEDYHGAKHYQKTYSAQFDNYLLNIINNYSTEVELEENEKLLRSVYWLDQR